MIERLQHDGMRIETTYGSSVAAISALRDGACDVAGLHVPIGPMQDAALTHHWRWLAGDEFTAIDVATRRQGFMVAPGSPNQIYEVADLTRSDVRFINRQANSGTRFLLEGLLKEAEVAPGLMAGFEQGEFAHAAVAAYVASGMADVGFGVEAPARQFKLDYLPLANERYFLLCRTAVLETTPIQDLASALRDPLCEP